MKIQQKKTSMDKIAENSTVYDVIIVGAGISGSNAAYILKKRCKNIKILILEAKGNNLAHF